MGSCVRFTAACAAVALAAALAFGGDGHDGQLPKTPAEALDWSKELIEAARKAKSAETPEIAKGIRRAVDWMQPFVGKGSADDSWAATWNEALTLSRFHGNKPTGDYVLRADSAVQDTIAFGLPTGGDWTFTAKYPGKGEQCWGEIVRSGAGRMGAKLEIDCYRFDTVYSGVGGENATGLAKQSFGWYREKFTKVESGGKQVTAKPLSRAFDRAQFFEVVGQTAEGPARVRVFLAKTKLRTYGVNAWQYRDVKEGDSPLETWRRGGDDPELEAILASFEEREAKKK
jgi:hypothetical protein